MRSALAALSLAALMALAACTKTYGPSSSDSSSSVYAGPSQAVVVGGFDMAVGGSGINYLSSPDFTDYRLAFHCYDPATQQLANPPFAFYLEQRCAGAVSGKACGSTEVTAWHGVVAVPPGRYILAFVHSYTPGHYMPLGPYSGTTVGAFTSVVNAVPIVYTNNVVGSLAAVPGASVAGNKAPRVEIAAGEVVYIGVLDLHAANWLKPQAGAEPGLAELYLTVRSLPGAARATLDLAGIDSSKMVERLAAPQAP